MTVVFLHHTLTVLPVGVEVVVVPDALLGLYLHGLHARDLTVVPAYATESNGFGSVLLLFV